MLVEDRQEEKKKAQRGDIIMQDESKLSESFAGYVLELEAGQKRFDKRGSANFLFPK